MTSANQELFARLSEDSQTALLAGLALRQNGNGHGPQSSPAPASQTGPMPELPVAARIDPVLGNDACPWLDGYIAFSRTVSPRAYDSFHEACGIWLLSTVAAGRLESVLGRKLFQPSLYIALVAHTTLHAKTTTARVAQELLREVGLAHLQLPNDTTPQAMVSRMMLRPDFSYAEMTPEQQAVEARRLMFPAQKGWFYDEFGSKVSAMMRENGPMADFRGLLRVLDDHPPDYEYVTLTRRDFVEQPYLALMASMTPADIRRFAGRDALLWADGFWPRFAFVTPPLDEPVGHGRFPDVAYDFPSELIQPLQQWHERLGIPHVQVTASTSEDGRPTGRYVVSRDSVARTTCTLGEGVLNAFYAYHDGLVHLAHKQTLAGNSDLAGNYGRFAEKAMRVAMLLASQSSDGRIELAHWARAQTITERWRGCLHNLAEQVNAPAASEESHHQEQILATLQRHGPMTPNGLSKFIRGLSTPEIQQLCVQFERSGALRVINVTNKGTKQYDLAPETDA